MKLDFKKSLFIYLSVLFSFSIFYLYIKHTVGNDSTISEWFINYTGGFTKRGIIGQISIFFSRLFDVGLRDFIFGFQVTTIFVYFLLTYSLLKNLRPNRIFLLAIFSPIFLLYPVAEIEVLARKEVFIFIILITYILIPIYKKFEKDCFTLVFLFIGILIWEPLIFFMPFWFAIDLIQNKIEKVNFIFIKKIFIYLPSLLLAFYIAFNPITADQHQKMADILQYEFNERCYMSCELLLHKAGLYQQFQAQFGKYSAEVLIRYFLIYLIGFGPLIILLRNSKLKDKIIFFKNFNNIFFPFLIIISPVIVLHSMGYDWGRWVNIAYVFSLMSYIFLYKNNFLIVNEKSIKNNFISKIKRGYFIFLFIIFCFGWNPKTVITGDVASFPGYRIPYKAMKILIN